MTNRNEHRLIIAPSALSLNFASPSEQLKIAEEGGAEYLHLDVMDGIFVPNISFGPCVISSFKRVSGLVFDVHLMITEPIRYIESFANAGADIITFHCESCENHIDVIDKIKSFGIKASVSIKPKTDVSAIKHLLPLVDMVLVMSVEPGFGGQKFMPEVLDKIEELKKLRDENGYVYDIEIDGGIGEGNIGLVTGAGANVIVAGSSVFGKNDIAGAIKGLIANSAIQ